MDSWDSIPGLAPLLGCSIPGRSAPPRMCLRFQLSPLFVSNVREFSLELKFIGASMKKTPLLVLGLALLAAPAQAQLCLRFDFDDPGISPATHPLIAYAVHTGLSESLLYSVSDGVLKQRTFSLTGSSFYYAGAVSPSLPTTPLVLDPALSTTIEARLEVFAIDGLAGAHLQALDGSCYFSFAWGPDGVFVTTDTGFVLLPMNVFGVHTYRMESPGDSASFSVYIDDQLIFQGTAAEHTQNTASWGDGFSTAGNGADCDWDFVRIEQDCPDMEAPIADPGSDQGIHAGDAVSLDGSASFDDTTAGVDLIYAWTLTTPVGSSAALDDPASATPAFISDVIGTYVARLVVLDEAGNASAPVTIEISSTNSAPTADSGDDQVVAVGDAVVLDGFDSMDPDGDPIAFAWTLIEAPSGSSAVLVDASTPTPVVVPDLPGEYILELVVSDHLADSSPTQVSVTAIAPAGSAKDLVRDAADCVRGLSRSDFDARGHKRVMRSGLRLACREIRRGHNSHAAYILQRLITRVDGVALRGHPDPKGWHRAHRADWIVCDDAAQVLIYGKLTDALALLCP